MNKAKFFVMSGVYAVVIYIITANTPTIPAVSDYAYYVDMAQGNPVPEPWNKRILVPFLASLFGGTEQAFHYINLALLLVSCLMLAYLYADYLVPLFFVLGTITMPNVVGEAGVDSMIYFLVVLSLLVSFKKLDYTMPLISVLAALTHPIALVLTSIIFISEKKPYVIVIGAILFIVALIPVGSYGLALYLPDFQRFKWTIFALSFLWVGVLLFPQDLRDRYMRMEGVRDIFIILCCFGFTFLASHAGRMMAPAGVVLAPRASEFLKSWFTWSGES